MGKNLLDYYSKMAHEQGYLARSVYKLQEMDRKWKLFRPAFRVLDLGAAPGSWSQYIIGRIAQRGQLVAVDLQDIDDKIKKPNMTFIKADINSSECQSRIAQFAPYDIIVSDMAPSTTGNRLVDTSASLDLVEQLLALDLQYLKTGGALVFKLFQGADEQALLRKLRLSFDTVKRFRPKAVRSESFEHYFVNKSFTGEHP